MLYFYFIPYKNKMTKAKKLPKERKIAKAIISNPLYQKKKAKSKAPHRFDIWEDSVVGGLHIFEWIVIGLVSMVVFGIVTLGLNASAIKTGGAWGSFCPSCKTTIEANIQ